MKSKINKFPTEIKKSSRRTYFQLIALLLFSFSIQAQDKKAKDLLNEVTSIVKSYDNIVIDFKYSLNNSQGKHQSKQQGKCDDERQSICFEFHGSDQDF